MDLEFDNWFDNMYTQLRKVARKHGFSVNVPTKNGIHQFADFIIVLNENSMLGLTLNPESSVQPFKLFPQGVNMGLSEIDEFLDGFAVARDNLG